MILSDWLMLKQSVKDSRYYLYLYEVANSLSQQESDSSLLYICHYLYHDRVVYLCPSQVMYPLYTYSVIYFIIYCNESATFTPLAPHDHLSFVIKDYGSWQKVAEFSSDLIHSELSLLL